jgi:C2H2-type zinc finger
MATRKEKGEQGEKIKVDDMEVNVKTPPPSKVRPVYQCQTCDASFPSQLDLDEHMKIDHNKNSKKDSVIV